MTPQDFVQETRYRVIRELASGGMGKVYEAQQLGADGFSKRVALKVLHPWLSESSEFAQMFVGEARLVANLIHPNIVQIYQLGRAAFGAYIAMELIEGMSLRHFLDLHAGKAVPVELATFIVSRLARALEYAHERTDDQGQPLGLVHRDVSPNNILISSEGEVKLADFGVAKAAHYLESQEGEQVYGRVEYMAPEQASCQVTDGRSDLFSLGVVYYELLTGKNPFLVEGEGLSETLTRLLTTRLSSPPGLTPMLAATLDRCLAPDPNERLESAGKLGYELEYAIYHKGYGPTIQTLARYMRNLEPLTRSA